MKHPFRIYARVAFLCTLVLPSSMAFAQMANPDAPTYLSEGGTKIRLLLDQAVLGGSEVEIAEIEFAPGTLTGGHVHGAIEIFYVLEGELEHIVNGKSYHLKPGMMGFVRPPDEVNHKVGPNGCKALVIWAPGGEGARIVKNWKKEEGK